MFLELDFVRAPGVDTGEPFRTVARLARERRVKVTRVASYKAGGVLDELVGLPEDESEATLADATAGVNFGLDHVAAAGHAWAVGDLKTVRANLSPAETPLIVFLHTPSGRRIGDRSTDDTTAALRSPSTRPGPQLRCCDLRLLSRREGRWTGCEPKACL